MKSSRPLLFISSLCHMFISIQSLITLEEANKSAFDYLKFKHSRLSAGRIGNDQIQMPTTVQDVKLASLDPHLYRLVKDPVQRKFAFTLEDAVSRNEIFDTKKLRKKFPQTTTTTPIPVIKGPYTTEQSTTMSTFLEKLDTNLFGIDLKSKFNQLKGALHEVFPISSNDQVSSQTNRRYHMSGHRRPPFHRRPGFRSRNQHKFVPYFTFPKYLPSHKQQRLRGPPSQAPPPAISREFLSEDPNADLESFENFGQDYTKSPDNHSDPPEFTTPSAKYKYIPVQHQVDSYLPEPLQSTPQPILPTPLYHQEGPRGRPKLFRPPRKSPIPFLKFKPKYRRPVVPLVPIENEVIPIPVTEEPKQAEQPKVSPQLTYSPEGFLINNELPQTNGDGKTPTDRGVKTRFFTRITDVTTEGGDDPPIRTIVSQGPFIYDDQDLTFATVKPFEEEDKIDEEIPIYMNDISRDDGVERIDWAKGPATYNSNAIRGSMTPAYYPERDLARVHPPYRRMPDYDDTDYYDVPSYETQPRYHHMQASPTTTPVYEAVQDALQIHKNHERSPVTSRPVRYEERPIIERPRSSPSEVTGPHNFIQNDRRHLLPGQRRRLRQQQPSSYRPVDYNSDDEVQEKFHDDRRRNLQTFFKDNNMMDDSNLQHPIMGRYSIDDNTEETDRIIPPPNNFVRETDEEEDDNDEFESNFASEAKLKDPFEFPSHFFAKESGNEVSNPFGDPDWDSFFNGHADNIEKDIHSLSRGADDHTAPPEDYQQADENQQGGGDQTPEYEGIDYEQVPEVPNYREQDQNEYPEYDYYQQQKQPIHISRDYDDYGQPGRQEDYNELRHSAPGGEEDYNNFRPQPSGQGDYSEYDVPRNINDPDYDEYVEYDIPEGRTDPPRHQNVESKGYDDYYASDGTQGDFFGPAFDDFFQKVENGVEDEITSSPNYHPYNPSARDNWEQDEENHHKHHEPDDNYQRSFDKVTYNDLRPNDFDNNHPDTIDFQMPSHDELQKKYKTVSTSASELVQHVVLYQPSTKRPIKKYPIKKKRRFRLTSKHR